MSAFGADESVRFFGHVPLFQEQCARMVFKKSVNVSTSTKSIFLDDILCVGSSLSRFVPSDHVFAGGGIPELVSWSLQHHGELSVGVRRESSYMHSFLNA